MEVGLRQIRRYCYLLIINFGLQNYRCSLFILSYIYINFSTNEKDMMFVQDFLRLVRVPTNALLFLLAFINFQLRALCQASSSITDYRIKISNEAEYPFIEN
jgi:hypothetical protein